MTKLLCVFCSTDEADKSLVNCASWQKIVKYRFDQNVNLRLNLVVTNQRKNRPDDTNSRRLTQSCTLHRIIDASCRPQLHCFRRLQASPGCPSANSNV